MPLTVHDAILAPAFDFKASLTLWSRLEVLPTTSDYAPALEARVADPLWLMARQWQFGEFQGEDAGSPIEVQLDGSDTPLDRFLPSTVGDAVDYDPLQLPIEALIEAEDRQFSGLVAAAAAGAQFLRMLQEKQFDATPFRERTEWKLDIKAPDDPTIDKQGFDWAVLLAAGALDGHKLAAAIADSNGVPAVVPSEPGLAELCREWLDWYRGGLGPILPTSWASDRLEYRCAAGAGKGPSRQTLVVDEYSGGRLDWYSFDLGQKPDLGDGQESHPINMGPALPTPARFGGMPVDRFWEFEDGRVNLARVKAGPTEIAKLLLLEFALAYGNDWFLIPLALPVGSVFKVDQLRVTDTFGRETRIGPAATKDGPWHMFELSSDDGDSRGSFLLAPTIQTGLEGDPLEEVGLFRDEMANMAWGVERKTQGPMGLPVDRYRAASMASANTALEDLSNVKAELIYRVATTVPENWIPFVPVPLNDRPLAEFGIELERRAMKRQDTAAGDPRVHPTGLLLRSDPSSPVGNEKPLRLKDEEVPRQGAVVTRSAQFTRWSNGERLHWIGRRKSAGRGEGASGLRFDTLTKRPIS